MKSIVVLSGKGGVGKSSITASLALAFSKNKNKIICADCDVDASNLSLLFGIHEDNYSEWNYLSTNNQPIIDETKCTSCNRCINECYFNAIELNPINKKPKVNLFGCESCGVCRLVCPADAINFTRINNAKIGYSITDYGFRIACAQLLPGSTGSGKVVYSVKQKCKEISEKDTMYCLIDSPAGVGCPVIASVSNSDYAILVTEPTLSGFYDLKKAIEIVNHFKIPVGIIINKCDLNLNYTKIIEKYARKNNFTVLKKIEFDKQFVKSLNAMKPIYESGKKYEEMFNQIYDSLILKLH